MKRITITGTVFEFDSRDELNAEDAQLLRLADEAGRKAYAPYSSFYVGAAVLLQDGTIVSGNNQENVAYPSGLCAERVALFHAGANYPDVPVKAIAVTCRSPKFVVSGPLSPCGACRQVIAETEKRYGQPVRIILAGENGSVYMVESIKELLPLSFEADELKSK